MKRATWTLVLGAMTVLAAGCSDSVETTGGSGKDAAHVPISAAIGTTASGATLTTDRDDYQPGQALNLVGSGWPAGDVVSIHLDETPQNHAAADWTVTADQDGHFVDATYLVQQSDLGVTFTITATSGTNGETATASFTDGGPPAAFTATNSTADGAGHCKNGGTPDPVNCNLYDGKQYAWLNGGPDGAQLGDGTYFFAVLVPGGENSAVNDAVPTVAGDLNLSDNHDAYTNRTFTVAGGVTSYAGTHDFDASANKIRLMPYDNTTNSGGVYALAICQLVGTSASPSGYPVDPNNCKYDNFKVEVPPCVGPDCPGGGHEGEADLTIAKTITTDWTRTFKWSIDKKSDVAALNLTPNNTGTVNYTVTLSHNGGISVYGYTGTVTVTNVSATETATNVGLADPLATLACKLNDANVTLPVAELKAGEHIDCTYSGIPSTGDAITNTATVTWDGNAAPLTKSAEVIGTFTVKDVDDCVDANDPLDANSPYHVCVGDLGGATSKDFTYSKTVGPWTSVQCGDKDPINNTAAITAPASSTGSKSLSIPVKVTGCAQLHVTKFYDANANGVKDGAEVDITGWKVKVNPLGDYTTPKNFGINDIAFGNYTVSEYASLTGTWFATKATSVAVTLGLNDNKYVSFGNVCVGAGGGLTLGFWSNTNGQAIMKASDNYVSVLAGLVALNLRNANGTAFDPANYTAFRTWILGANATNMANMLSAQMAAMWLNVRYGKVAGGALIYAPGTLSANAAGFASVSALLTEANASLSANGNTTASGAVRNYQEALKIAFDKANNNLNIVQASPCGFSF